MSANNKVSFTVHFLDLSDKNVKITLNGRLRKGLLEERILSEFIGSDNCIVPAMYPPIFLQKNKNSYGLVARHFAYAFYVYRYLNVSRDYTLMPAIVFNDEGLLEGILKLEESELRLFSNESKSNEALNCETFSEATNQTKLKKTTQSRHKAINAGRVCPFCGEALQSPLERKKGEDGYYKITCFNKSKGCGFYSILTDFEFKKFIKYELPTHQWLLNIPDKKCPICNQEVYQRIVHNSETAIVRYEKCRNHHQSTKMDCKHIIRF